MPRGGTGKPPQPRTQVAVRLKPDVIDAVEERAAELAFRTRLPVTFSDMVKMGLELLMLQPLPPRPVRSRCNVIDAAAGGRKCLTCLEEVDDECPRTGLAVGATHA